MRDAVGGIRETSASDVTVGLLRESVLHRYAQYCNLVRGRLLIDQQKQSVNIQDLVSGGRGRRFESSHPDQYFQLVTADCPKQGLFYLAS